jgi:hypothetical protein
MKPIVALAAVLFLLVAETASARTTCGNLPKIDVYGVAGPSCVTADAVAKAASNAVLHGKLYRRTSYTLAVSGQSWRLTVSSRNTSGTIPGTDMSYSEIETYRATNGDRLVTFHSYGSN